MNVHWDRYLVRTVHRGLLVKCLSQSAASNSIAGSRTISGVVWHFNKRDIRIAQRDEGCHVLLSPRRVGCFTYSLPQGLLARL